MASTLYAKGKEALLDGTINYLYDTIKAVLVDTGSYTPNTSTDENLDDIPGAARIAVSSALTSKTVTDGVADAADITFSIVSGAQSEAIVLYKDTGVESSSRLLVIIDTATGLPVTPDGGNISVAWSNGASRIFAL